MSATKTEILSAVRNFAREPYAWPGGYPKILFMADGEILCANCAKYKYRLISAAVRTDDRCSEWMPAGVEIHWEGAPHICAHCGGEIESAYGRDEDEVQP